MSICVVDVHKSFGSGSDRKEVLRGVDLKINSGSMYVLTGPNGSGKTTLLKLLATLVVPERGAISINGCDALKHPVKARRFTGLVYDAERSFYQMLTAEENISFYARMAGVDGALLGERFDLLCNVLNISSFRDTKFGHCSSGVRQKLAIARALITDPPVILSDEPTRSIDEASKAEICNYLKTIVSSGGKTCIVVTHDRAEALALGGRAGFLEEGKLKE
ncbi:MAG: hypothetical protein A2219_04515 [Elusimicrobia bacterium RIFOXYA2_FULL_50_26]|nr:MAG: hypothetical protein A2219_04515 [Elusimicrobia bacterium RIFOXYA2_FULL_50_26]